MTVISRSDPNDMAMDESAISVNGVTWDTLYLMLENENSAYVVQALDTLQAGSSESLYLVVLRSLMSHESSLVRDEATARLGGAGTDSDLHRLIAASRDRAWIVRCSAASSLSGWPEPESKLRLLAMSSSDRVATVRRWAIHALYDQGIETNDLKTFFEERYKIEASLSVKIAICGCLVRLREFGFFEELQRISAKTQQLKGRTRSILEENIELAYGEISEQFGVRVDQLSVIALKSSS